MTIHERFKEIGQVKNKILTANYKNVIIRKNGFSSNSDENF